MSFWLCQACGSNKGGWIKKHPFTWHCFDCKEERERDTPSPMPYDAIDQARGDVHHHLEPGLGFLRLAIHDRRTLTPEQLESLAVRLETVMDLMDRLLGEIPIGVQIDMLKKELKGEPWHG